MSKFEEQIRGTRETKELLKRLPKKYHDRVIGMEAESDLVDDCKWMLYFTEEYTDDNMYGSDYPVRNFSEAISIIKSLEKVSK